MEADPKKLRTWGRLLSTLLQTPDNELDDFVRDHPDLFPPHHGYRGGIRMVAPEALAQIVSALLKKGYAQADVIKILGGNFLRAARQTWAA